VNPLSDTFDDYVDDILSSDFDLLKGELDFLVMQHLFNSIDLKRINKTEFKEVKINLSKTVPEGFKIPTTLYLCSS